MKHVLRFLIENISYGKATAELKVSVQKKNYKDALKYKIIDWLSMTVWIFILGNIKKTTKFLQCLF